MNKNKPEQPHYTGEYSRKCLQQNVRMYVTFIIINTSGALQFMNPKIYCLETKYGQISGLENSLKLSLIGNITKCVKCYGELDKLHWQHIILENILENGYNKMLRCM